MMVGITVTGGPCPKTEDGTETDESRCPGATTALLAATLRGASHSSPRRRCCVLITTIDRLLDEYVYFTLAHLTRSVSYFYIANFIGSFSAGMLNVYVTDRIGVGMVSPDISNDNVPTTVSNAELGDDYRAAVPVHSVYPCQLFPTIPCLCLSLHPQRVSPAGKTTL